MKKAVTLIIGIVIFLGSACFAQLQASSNLRFDTLPTRWDDAFPMGNGMVGALVWKNEKKLRFSLDRADLWDERPAMKINAFTYKFVQERVKNGDYDTVRTLGDDPYDNVSYPTKLPAGAIEFDIATFGDIAFSELDISTAVLNIKWKTGAFLRTYVCAKGTSGVFKFLNVHEGFEPSLKMPVYEDKSRTGVNNTLDGHALALLGYRQGNVKRQKNKLTYTQTINKNESYKIILEWKQIANGIEGNWSVEKNVSKNSIKFISEKSDTALKSHTDWWSNYWKKSSVSLPDQVLQRQYDLDMYKFGSVARSYAPAITLQAVWTADNGNLPPWKGDFHNDLNTQLSYWPAFTGNHLEEAKGMTNWLWQIKAENEKFTNQYFQVAGLNVPGVATLSGYPMGGYIQYSLSATVSSWLAQNFYWQYKYSMDKTFLKEKAYPYVHEVATFLENITSLKNGIRTLPLSTSPEYHENELSAYFPENSNFDVALMHFVFSAAAELAAASGSVSESAHWQKIKGQLPELSSDETGLHMAPGIPRVHSHRHHSNLLAIYPIGLLTMNNESDRKVIKASLQFLEKQGTRSWVGYSFPWAACLYARANDGDKAYDYLKKFATNFVGKNSFHLNGDQKKGEFSNFTYRPFTLEGNFAFAQGIHEMLMRSSSGYIECFPAIPHAWKNISFKNLRAEGAFLVSGKIEEGMITEIDIKAEVAGVMRIKLPFKTFIAYYENGQPRQGPFSITNGVFEIKMRAGEKIILKNGYE